MKTLFGEFISEKGKRKLWEVGTNRLVWGSQDDYNTYRFALHLKNAQILKKQSKPHWFQVLCPATAYSSSRNPPYGSPEATLCASRRMRHYQTIAVGQGVALTGIAGSIAVAPAAVAGVKATTPYVVGGAKTAYHFSTAKIVAAGNAISELARRGYIHAKYIRASISGRYHSLYKSYVYRLAGPINRFGHYTLHLPEHSTALSRWATSVGISGTAGVLVSKGLREKSLGRDLTLNELLEVIGTSYTGAAITSGISPLSAKILPFKPNPTLGKSVGRVGIRMSLNTASVVAVRGSARKIYRGEEFFDPTAMKHDVTLGLITSGGGEAIEFLLGYPVLRQPAHELRGYTYVPAYGHVLAPTLAYPVKDEVITYYYERLTKE